MIKLSSLDTLHNGTLVGHLQLKSQIIWTGKWFKLIIDLFETNLTQHYQISTTVYAVQSCPFLPLLIPRVQCGGQLAGEC